MILDEGIYLECNGWSLCNIFGVFPYHVFLCVFLLLLSLVITSINNDFWFPLFSSSMGALNCIIRWWLLFCIKEQRGKINKAQLESAVNCLYFCQLHSWEHIRIYIFFFKSYCEEKGVKFHTPSYHSTLHFLLDTSPGHRPQLKVRFSYINTP